MRKVILLVMMTLDGFFGWRNRSIRLISGNPGWDQNAQKLAYRVNELIQHYSELY